jgi:hypothetical protein
VNLAHSFFTFNEHHPFSSSLTIPMDNDDDPTFIILHLLFSLSSDDILTYSTFDHHPISPPSPLSTIHIFIHSCTSGNVYASDEGDGDLCDVSCTTQSFPQLALH